MQTRSWRQLDEMMRFNCPCWSLRKCYGICMEQDTGAHSFPNYLTYPITWKYLTFTHKSQLTFSQKFPRMAPKRILITHFSIVSSLVVSLSVVAETLFWLSELSNKVKLWPFGKYSLDCHIIREYNYVRRRAINLHRSQHLNFSWHQLPRSNNISAEKITHLTKWSRHDKVSINN